MAIPDDTRAIHWDTMFWLVVLSTGGAITALIIDEAVLPVRQY